MFHALLPMNQDCSSKISVLRFQANFCRLGDLNEIMSLEGKCCWGKLCRIVEQLECVICQKPAPPTPHSPPPIERFRPLPTQTGQQWLDKRQLGSFLVSQVARCKCTLLAGNSPISLAGSVEQIRFSQQSPKMLKMASESIKHALLQFSGLFLNDSLWVPLSVVQQIGSLQVEKRCCRKSVNPVYGVTHA